MATNNEPNNLLQWVIGILVMISMGVSSYAISRIDQAVMKSDYFVDQARLEHSISDIALDVKQILQRLPSKER